MLLTTQENKFNIYLGFENTDSFEVSNTSQSDEIFLRHDRPSLRRLTQDIFTACKLKSRLTVQAYGQAYGLRHQTPCRSKKTATDISKGLLDYFRLITGSQDDIFLDMNLLGFSEFVYIQLPQGLDFHRIPVFLTGQPHFYEKNPPHVTLKYMYQI